MQKEILLPKALPDGFKEPCVLSGFPKNAPILVGFSGGADSSALLIMLKVYCDKNGAPLYAAHLNHGIRGEEADRDEHFCKELAEALGVKFFSKKLCIPEIAKQSGEGIENAARNARYSFFDEIMTNNSIPILATAHNADDNLETVIFNLSRGAGLSGLCGIPDSRDLAHGKVIRPILTLEKQEIIEFCKSCGVDFVTDSTNLENDYTRNKIRNQIVPILKEINSGVIKNTSRATEALKEDSLCLQGMADRFVEENFTDYSVDLKVLCDAQSSITNRAIIEIYGRISSGTTLETTHVNAIKRLAKRAIPHSSVSLPKGIEATIENGKLCFVPQKKEIAEICFSKTLSVGKNEINTAGVDIYINSEQYSKNIYKKSTVLYITFDKIKGDLVARNRQAGDKILSGGVHKSLKKLMNEKKIPLYLRSRIPIICDDDGILAIPFVALRDGAKAPLNSNDNEKTVIAVCIQNAEN